MKLGQLNLLNELLLTDSDETFMNYSCFSKNEFWDLLSQVRAKITKKSTNYRQAIFPKTRLALTLRYLARGNSKTTLHHEFRVEISTV